LGSGLNLTTRPSGAAASHQRRLEVGKKRRRPKPTPLKAPHLLWRRALLGEHVPLHIGLHAFGLGLWSVSGKCWTREDSREAHSNNQRNKFPHWDISCFSLNSRHGRAPAIQVHEYGAFRTPLFLAGFHIPAALHAFDRRSVCALYQTLTAGGLELIGIDGSVVVTVDVESSEGLGPLQTANVRLGSKADIPHADWACPLFDRLCCKSRRHAPPAQ